MNEEEIERMRGEINVLRKQLLKEKSLGYKDKFVDSVKSIVDNGDITTARGIVSIIETISHENDELKKNRLSRLDKYLASLESIERNIADLTVEGFSLEYLKGNVIKTSELFEKLKEYIGDASVIIDDMTNCRCDYDDDDY